jgi:hypothetical protein
VATGTSLALTGGNLVLPSGGVVNWTNRGSVSQGVDGTYTFSNNLGTNTFTLAAGASGLATFGGPVTLAGNLSVGGSLLFTGKTTINIPNDGSIRFANSSGSAAGIIYFPTNGEFRLGGVDGVASGAQTISTQNVVAGTSNTAGGNLTISGSQGTGTGAGGSIVFKVAPAGTTGTSQNALSPAMTINPDTSVTFANVINISGITFPSAANLVWTGKGDISLPTSGSYRFNNFGTSATFYLTGTGSNAFQLGPTDAAAPVAQTVGVQNVVAGTSNTAGVDLTINGSQGTGTGAGGKILFKTAAAGTTGSTQNALATQLTLDAALGTTVTGNLTVTGTCTGCGGGAVTQLQANSTATSGTSAPSWAKLYSPAFTANDTATTGTNSIVGGYWLDTPTFTATNARTYTNAASLYINAPPTCSTNTTCTSREAIAAGSGDIVALSGNVKASGNISTTAGTVSGFTVTASGVVTTPGTYSTLTGQFVCSVGTGGGTRGFVTDSTVSTFGSTVAGSGSNHVPVWCDDSSGTWKVG